jgi:hypothetical protein
MACLLLSLGENPPTAEDRPHMFELRSPCLPRLASRAALLLACGSALALACSGGGDQTQLAGAPQAETGRVRLALTARGASGALYRLRNATFQIEQLGGGSEPVPPPFLPPRPLPVPGAPGSGGLAGVEAPVAPADEPPGGVAGSGPAAGGAVGVGGSAPVAGAGGATGGFVTFLSTEDDPRATTLETDLPAGAFIVTLFEGWTLERVVGGTVTTVDARLSTPATQDFFIASDEETFVGYRFETGGVTVDLGTGRLIIDIEVDENGGGVVDDPRLTVMENAREALPFSLEETLATALANAGSGLDALAAYHSIIDSYATAADGRDPSGRHCDDQLTAGTPSLNGFELQCGRLEAQQFDNLGAWFATAAVNRLDLAPADGATCGQQRLVFANSSGIGNGRMLMILESEVPNPTPECGVEACAPIARFWSELALVTDPAERGERLRRAFLTGDPELSAAGFAPFVNAAQLGPNGGQIRTNNFNDSPWTLREFHFLSVEQPPVPVPVAESPNGALWNDSVASPAGEACRESFVRAAELGLMSSDPAALSFPVDQACKDAESRNDFSQDYVGQLLSGSGELSARLDAVAAPFGLSAVDLAARARFAGSCIGCHSEASGSSLGGGLNAPFQFDFVHVSEFGAEPCGNGGTCFGISEGLRTVFLPARARVTRVLAEGPSCGGVAPPLEPVPIDGSAGAAGDVPDGGVPANAAPLRTAQEAARVRFTLGGHVVGPHAH